MNEGTRANQDGWFDDEPAGAQGEVREDRRITKKTGVSEVDEEWIGSGRFLCTGLSPQSHHVNGIRNNISARVMGLKAKELMLQQFFGSIVKNRLH